MLIIVGLLAQFREFGCVFKQTLLQFGMTEVYEHQPGQLDFQIVTKDVSVTEFRRKPSAVWAYLKTPGHVIFFTRRGKRDYAIMSIETHACLSGNYENTMHEIEEAAAAWREEQKARRRAKKEAQHDTREDRTVSEKSD